MAYTEQLEDGTTRVYMTCSVCLDECTCFDEGLEGWTPDHVCPRCQPPSTAELCTT